MTLPSRELNEDDVTHGEFLPDPGKDYVIKAGATIGLDFSKNPERPDVTVKASSISYGNSAVEKALNIRSVGQIIVDFFRRMFGLTSVKDISVEAQLKSGSRLSASPDTPAGTAGADETTPLIPPHRGP